MPFEKGNKLGGRKEGAKGEKTKQWEALGESITTKHTERFNKILSECDDKTFVQHYQNILEFFKPKLQRTELTGEDNGAITIKVIRE